MCVCVYLCVRVCVCQWLRRCHLLYIKYTERHPTVDHAAITCTWGLIMHLQRNRGSTDTQRRGPNEEATLLITEQQKAGAHGVHGNVKHCRQFCLFGAPSHICHLLGRCQHPANHLWPPLMSLITTPDWYLCCQCSVWVPHVNMQLWENCRNATTLQHNWAWTDLTFTLRLTYDVFLDFLYFFVFF